MNNVQEATSPSGGITRINLVADAQLVELLREHQAELRRSTGLRPSLSATAVRLLRQGLEKNSAASAA